MLRLISFVALFTTCCFAMYDNDKHVVKLTADNFKDLVINSDELWFVEFYAPWCGHCQKMEPAWKQVAKRLKGVVNVGAVDMTTDQSVGQPYNV